MDAVREQVKNPVVVGIIGFILGVIFGLIVLGWWLWPVEWTNANPEDLMPEEQSEYLRMSIEAFGYSGDGERAQSRYTRLGEDAEPAMELIEINPENMDAKLLLDYKAAVSAPTSMLEDSELEPETEATLSAEEILLPEEAGENQVEEEQPEEIRTEESESNSLLGTFWPVVCLVVFVVAAAGVVLFILRGRGSQEPQPQFEAYEGEPPDSEVPWEEYSAASETSSEESLIGQFMASYQHGDEMFDESFSIDSQTGEFLGECGIGVSETIGVGDPKKVTAFDIWLFDKNDIQTVTKVLMSSSAFNDDELRQQVAAKGEPIRVELGERTTLGTQTLNLVAEVIDMTYGEGSMPQESYFERLIVEFRITQKV
ncbi:MAG: hypothetical protein ACK2U3_00045 [Anaerolineales bacterium]|jgi:hypothetical protein